MILKEIIHITSSTDFFLTFDIPKCSIFVFSNLFAIVPQLYKCLESMAFQEVILHRVQSFLSPLIDFMFKTFIHLWHYSGRKC